MGHKYSNWMFSKQTFAPLDAGHGRPLLSTGEEPRVVFQLACYQGTNTAGSEIGFFIIPGTAGAGIQADGTVPIADNVSFSYGKVDAAITATNELVPLQFAPYGTKGTTNGAWSCIIPPNCMAVLACTGTNMNGTLIASCISAEVC